MPKPCKTPNIWLDILVQNVLARCGISHGQIRHRARCKTKRNDGNKHQEMINYIRKQPPGRSYMLQFSIICPCELHEVSNRFGFWVRIRGIKKHLAPLQSCSFTRSGSFPSLHHAKAVHKKRCIHVKRGCCCGVGAEQGSCWLSLHQCIGISWRAPSLAMPNLEQACRRG